VNHLYNALSIYIEIVAAIVERAAGKGLEFAVYPAGSIVWLMD
jgi:hypothetical protein